MSQDNDGEACDPRGTPPEEVYDRARKTAEFNLEWYELRYEDTGNPIYVWKARRAARKASLDIPKWVEEYLDTCTDKLLHIQEDTRGRFSERVARALEFTPSQGRGNEVSEIEKESRDMILFAAVRSAIEAKDYPEDAAIFLVSEVLGDSESTVRRAYKTILERVTPLKKDSPLC